MEVNCVKIENGKEYIVLDVIVTKDGKYLILSNEDNEYDFQIRKVITTNDEEYMTKLNSEEEYDQVMKEFYKKHNKKGE